MEQANECFDKVKKDCLKFIASQETKKEKFKNTQEIDDRGFFIGLHTTPITDKQLNFIEKNLSEKT